jgi:ABC-type transporter Mla subunit MlaD
VNTFLYEGKFAYVVEDIRARGDSQGGTASMAEDGVYQSALDAYDSFLSAVDAVNEYVNDVQSQVMSAYRQAQEAMISLNAALGKIAKITEHLDQLSEEAREAYNAMTPLLDDARADLVARSQKEQFA